MAHTRKLSIATISALLLVISTSAVNGATQPTKSVTTNNQPLPTGTFTCSDGTDHPTRIGFVAHQKGQTVRGEGAIFDPAFFFGFTIDDGQISDMRRFRFEGLTGPIPCDPPFNPRFTLIGSCGTGVTISYQDDQGNTGTFTGDVLCEMVKT